MALQFYSPKADGTGAALFVSVKPEGDASFRLMKQTSWDSASKKGGFAKGKTINVKFSPDEVCGLIHAVRTNGELSIYHQFEDKVTKGGFSYYNYPAKSKEEKARSGFGLSIQKDGEIYKVGFSHGAAERLSQFLSYGLRDSFNTILDADAKQDAEWKAKSKENAKPAATQEPATEEVQGEPPADNDW